MTHEGDQGGDKGVLSMEEKELGQRRKTTHGFDLDGGGRAWVKKGDKFDGVFDA